MKEIVNYHIKVFGRVQGVGYRFFARRAAERLCIAGFVRNNMDGTVSIEAEGNEDSLNEFLNDCRKGPGWSRVERVQYTKYPTSGHQGFCIK